MAEILTGKAFRVCASFHLATGRPTPLRSLPVVNDGLRMLELLDVLCSTSLEESRFEGLNLGF